MEMYDWHARHPEKGERFRRAMKGVSSCKLLIKIPKILYLMQENPFRLD